MTILMTMNIYIRPDLEERLRQEGSMSGLINNLLERHYYDTVDGGKTQEQVHANIRNLQDALNEAKVPTEDRVVGFLEEDTDKYPGYMIERSTGGVVDTINETAAESVDKEMLDYLKKNKRYI